jgi:DNA-3-methyladenine glycosylase I
LTALARCQLFLLERRGRLVTSEAVPGPDGRLRCPWATGAPEYLAYHDVEWGRPIRDDNALFERLSLEAFQSGLSWLTILRKRQNFRAAFAGFDIATVAAFDRDDRERLLEDAGIVRNRAKVDATIANARAALLLDNGLAAMLWRFAPDLDAPPPRHLPTLTPESTAMSKALKQQGFVFVGPTTSYALMQAAGLVNDHLAGCWVRDRVAQS